MDIIPLLFSIVIPVNFALFIHHIYYSHNYVANQADKLYYYITAIIPSAPAVMYSFTLIDYLTTEDDKDMDNPSYLQVFFKTWVISNPLLMINLGKIMNIPLENYLKLILADISVYIIGYASYKTTDETTFAITFSIATFLFCLIMGTLIHSYRTHKTAVGLSQMGPFYKFISYFTAITWACYPTVFILYKKMVINLETTSIVFICLDFLTKSVFSTVIILYHRHLNHRKSMIDFINRRVVPLETIIEGTNESVSTVHTAGSNVI